MTAEKTEKTKEIQENEPVIKYLTMHSLEKILRRSRLMQRRR